MQSRFESFIEQILNTGSGFLLSTLVWEYIVKPGWDIQTSFAENLSITALFTVVSVARSYLWRRAFNRRTNNKNKRHESTDCPDGPHARR